MKHLLLLMTLLVMVTSAKAESTYYFVDLKLIRAAYEGLTCQQGLDNIKKTLQDDDSKEDRGKMDADDRKIYQECRAKLANDTNTDLSTDLNKMLLQVLTHQPKCRCPIPTPKCGDDNLLILRLEANVFQDWTKQLRTQLTKSGSTEPNLLKDLLAALSYALGDRCNYSRKP